MPIPNQPNISRDGITTEDGFAFTGIPDLTGSPVNMGIGALPYGKSAAAAPTAAPDALTKQILGQNLTSNWSGEGFGSAEANARDMARILADIGITDINQFGKIKSKADATVQPVYGQGDLVQDSEGQSFYSQKIIGYVDQNGNPVDPSLVKTETDYGGESGNMTTTYKAPVGTQELFGNKLTGQTVANTYGERQMGNMFGGTYSGKGNTGYGVQFDEKGNPLFYTQGASSSDMGQLAPLLTMASFVPGLAPFAQGINALMAAKSGNVLGAIAGAAGLGGLTDVANAANFANAAKNKDVLSMFMSGANLGGVENIGDYRVNDIGQTANTIKAIQSKDPNALLGTALGYASNINNNQPIDTYPETNDDLISRLAGKFDNSSITAPTDIASLQGIFGDSGNQIISDAPFTGAPTNVASVTGRNVMNSGPASTRTLDSGAGLNPNTLSNWGGSKVDPNFIKAASPYLGWDPSTYFPKVDIRMAAPTAAYGNVPEYDYNPNQQTYLNIAPYLTNVANKYNEPGMTADVLTHELAHVGQKLSSRPEEDPTKFYLRMANQAGLSTADVFNRPSDITIFNKALNDAIPYISKTYGTNAGTYLGNPKAPLFEKLTDLVAIEMQTGKDLTKDPVLKETLFKDPRVQAMYNTLTIPRMTRLDPRDLPTGTVTTSDFPKGGVPFEYRLRNLFPAPTRGSVTRYAEGGIAEVEKGMDFSGPQDTMTTNSPQGTDMAASQAENPFSDPNTMAVYDQMRQTVSPKEFGDTMLDGAAQTAPEEVAAFRSALEQIQLPPEALDLLNNMVDEILANPAQYEQIRAKYKEMGAPDEILPEQFDPQFFAALNMAVDQMIGEPAGVQAFAKGGIAELSPVAKAIASYGRNGDTMLAHITPAEARMLRRKGGSGTINPVTGLPEFFLDIIGKAFKSIGNAVKKFASSTVGKLVTTVALGFFLGPAAASFMGATSTAAVAAVSGFVGSAGSTLLGGGNISQALKAGAIGGLTAGAGAGIMGGADAFTAGSYAGPTTIGGQFDRFTNAISPTASGIQAPSITPTGQSTGMASIPEQTINPLERQFATPAEIARIENMNPAYASDATLARQQVFNNSAQAPTNFVETPVGAAEQVFNAPVSATAAQAPVTAPVNAGATTAATGNTIAPPINVANPLDATQFEGSLAKPALGSEPGFFDKAKEFYNENISPSGIQQQGLPAAQEAGAKAVTDLVARMPDATPAMKEAAYQKAMNAASPGILSTYGPMTALGIGAIGAFGGFSPSKVPVSPFQDMLTGGPGSARDLMSKNPNRFYIQGLPGVKYYNGSVLKPTGMATGGEVQGFAAGGVSDQQVADWWASNSDKGYSDEYIAGMMDQFKVSPEQFARSVGANTADSADIARRYEEATAPKTGTNNWTVTNGEAGEMYVNTKTGETSSVAPPVLAGDNQRSASDQKIWDYFSNNTGLTDAQIVAAMNANKWSINDVARVTGTTDQIDDFNRRIAAVNAVNTKTVSTGTGTGTGTVTRSAADQAIWDYFQTPGLTDAQIVAAMDANKWTIGDIARVTGTTNQLDDFNRRIAAVRNVSTNTSKSTSTSTSTSKSTSTGTGGSTSITAPWFINPQTFAYGNSDVVVPSMTLRGKDLPTDAQSRAIQTGLQNMGPGASDASMQQWMDSQGYDPRQVAYAINTGLPEVQNRYYGAKNTGILGATAPKTTVTTPYNNTGGITQFMSPTGPMGEFSTRTVTPVSPVVPSATTGGVTSLPTPQFSLPGIQRAMPTNFPQNNAEQLLAQKAAVENKNYQVAMNDKNAAFMNMGGIAGLAQGGYPRKTGQIDGPGTATSDSIPAMLSDGEFVMTAKAVRGAGKGDRRAGAKRMYALMHQLEQNAARG